MKFTRILALSLMILLLFSLLGCQKIVLGEDKGENNAAKDQPDTSDPNVLTVVTVVSGDLSFRPEEGISQKGDQILARFREVEKQTGKTVQVSLVTEEKLKDDFSRAVRAGRKYADVIQADASLLAQYYQQGLLLSLTDAELEESATGVLRGSDGIAYGLRSDGGNNPLPTLSYLMYYNEKLLSDNSLPTPLEMRETNYWNWDTFMTLSENVSAASQREICSVAAPTETETQLIWATLHAAGTVYFDKDGTCIMDSAEGLNGFAKLRQLLTSGTIYQLGSFVNNEGDATAKQAFINRRTAFFVDNSARLFESDENSLTENLRENLRIIGFPAIKKGVAGSAFGEGDVFCAVTNKANKALCKELLPLLFAAEENADPRSELIADFFYHETDGEIYFNLLSKADTDTVLGAGENLDLLEEYFYQVALGASAKEYLSNFETIFNSQKG